VSRSKFAGVLDAARQREPEPEPEPLAAPTGETRQSPAQQEAPKIGRPRTGKRSNPDFEQVSVYVRKDTHRDVKIRLLQQGEGREFSELVEDLLAGWLKG
jgi:hypothetical protein